jgi:probable HAF family extracellular repeat protein
MLPGGIAASAIVINDAGLIAGVAYDSGGDGHAVAWTGGVLSDLGPLTPGDTQVAVQGLNNAGEFVGFSAGGGVVHAVIWGPSQGSGWGVLIT